MSDVTRLLDAAATGDPRAAGQLLPLVYQELRQLAAAKMANERPDHTLDATALVHETFLRLVGGENRTTWEHRRQFFAAAAEAMRRVLVDHARAYRAGKRGELPSGLTSARSPTRVLLTRVIGSWSMTSWPGSQKKMQLPPNLFGSSFSRVCP
jgi:RNA polymerase sigma factor (TIGR02999 family)